MDRVQPGEDDRRHQQQPVLSPAAASIRSPVEQALTVPRPPTSSERKLWRAFLSTKQHWLCFNTTRTCS